MATTQYYLETVSRKSRDWGDRPPGSGDRFSVYTNTGGVTPSGRESAWFAARNSTYGRKSYGGAGRPWSPGARSSIISNFPFSLRPLGSPGAGKNEMSFPLPVPDLVEFIIPMDGVSWCFGLDVGKGVWRARIVPVYEEDDRKYYSLTESERMAFTTEVAGGEALLKKGEEDGRKEDSAEDGEGGKNTETTNAEAGTGNQPKEDSDVEKPADDA
ncbi:hypothetical protein HK102_012626, partial [Quaeritorhiza haematococci]